MRTILIAGWRGRLIFDAYLRLPNGMGTNRQATESYVDLAENRGHSLPVTTTGWKLAGPEAGLRGGVQRLSSDAKIYRDGPWQLTRPDWFRKIDRAKWGLREEIYHQAKLLDIDEQSLIAGVTATQYIRPDVFLSNKQDSFDLQQIYFLECMDPFLPPGIKLIKIGLGWNPHQRAKQQQTGNAYPLIPRWAVSCHNSSAADNILRTAFKSNKMEGEWYWMTEEDIERLGVLTAKLNMMNLGGTWNVQRAI